MNLMTHIFKNVEDFQQFGDENPLHSTFAELWPVFQNLFQKYYVFLSYIFYLQSLIVLFL